MIEVRHGQSTVRRGLAYCLFVSIQVFTGAVPFAGNPTHSAMVSLTKGERPQQPTHPALTADLWKLMQRCWDHDPHLRPEISEALRVLTPLVPCPLRFSRIHSLGYFLMRSSEPEWKQSINNPLSTNERIHLINMVFSDHHRVEAAGRLFGVDAQIFVDMIDGVSPPLSLTFGGQVD